MQFVLVHGAFMAPSCWQAVSQELQSQGHRVFKPALTGVGERSNLLDSTVDLNTHITDVEKLIAGEQLDEVTVVGHSYAGMVITGVAEKLPERLKCLIYIDAEIPDDGESFFDLCPAPIVDALRCAAVDGWRVELPKGWSAASFGIDDPEQQREVEEAITAQPLGIFEQPLRAPTNAAKNLPRAFIHCADQRTAPYYSGAANKARREGMQYREIRSAHAAMVTHPKELARILIELAGFTPT
jgi:pimeloyl-ACP methyl ester carboxylesterase